MRWSSITSVRAVPGYIEPCLPTAAKQVPTGAEWVYEIKHDGYRLIYTRRGADWTKRFPRIVEAVQKLNVQSILLDGEGVVCDGSGLAIFDLLHSNNNDQAVTFCSFDLLELDGENFVPRPLTDRKAQLQKLLRKVKDGIQFNPHIQGDGALSSSTPASSAARVSSRSGSIYRISRDGPSAG